MTELKEQDDWGCTDSGNKDRFVEKYRDRLRFISEEKAWYAHDGTRWKQKDAKVYSKAERMAQSIYREAAECQDRTGRKVLGDWAKRSLSRASIENTLKLASEELAVSILEFDAEATQINLKNGLLDLRTKTLQPHSPGQLVMKTG